VETARCAFCVAVAGICPVTSPVAGLQVAAGTHEGCDAVALTGTVHMCFVLTQVAHGFAVAYAAESVGALVAFIPGFPYGLVVTELAMGVPGAVTAVIEETSFCALEVGTGMFTFTALRGRGTGALTLTGAFFASAWDPGVTLA
jgi:hypothetical protein